MACTTLFPCLAASHHPLGLPQNSANSFGFCSYKKHACNPLRICSYKTLDLKSFRICSYRERWVGGGMIMLTAHPPVYPKLLSQRAHSFTLFAKSENYLASIQSFAHSFLSRRTSMREPKTPGSTLFTGHWSLVYPERTRRGASVRRILAPPNPRRLP